MHRDLQNSYQVKPEMLGKRSDIRWKKNTLS